MDLMDLLTEHHACEPAMAWVAAQPDKSPAALWHTCPDASWMAWALSLLPLSERAKTARRAWAFATADRALRVHAVNALTSAAACTADDGHRGALLRHAETLTALPVLDGMNARAAARAAYDAADTAHAAADAAGYAAARAAYAAGYAATRAAADAAPDAAADAAGYAADAAGYAAERAAYAAERAAYAAASAGARAARAAERKVQADGLRAALPWTEVAKALNAALEKA